MIDKDMESAYNKIIIYDKYADLQIYYSGG